jgi:hypothetical protein
LPVGGPQFGQDEPLDSDLVRVVENDVVATQLPVGEAMLAQEH